MRPLTTLDLLQGQAKSEGHGLYGHEIRSAAYWCGKAENPYRAAEALDKLVVKLANKRGFDPTTLFNFMNSRLGRWAGDEISCSRGKEKMREILEKYLRAFCAPPRNFERYFENYLK